MRRVHALIEYGNDGALSAASLMPAVLRVHGRDAPLQIEEEVIVVRVRRAGTRRPATDASGGPT